MPKKRHGTPEEKLKYNPLYLSEVEESTKDTNHFTRHY